MAVEGRYAEGLSWSTPVFSCPMCAENIGLEPASENEMFLFIVHIVLKLVLNLAFEKSTSAVSVLKMAFSYFQLPRGMVFPFPPDNSQSFISEWYALSMRPVFQDPKIRDPHQPPTSPQYRLYKNSLSSLYDSRVELKKNRRYQVAATLRSLRREVYDSKKNFIEMFLEYNEMIKNNEINYRKCQEESATAVKKIKEMVTVQRKQTKANHSLLFIKDAMEEAADTYREAETFLKKAGRESMWESPERIHNRYSTLMNVRQELLNLEKKEIEESQQILNEMFDIQKKTIEKHTLLLAKARYLVRLIQDTDEGMLKLEKEEVNLTKMKDRAWRDYSIINMTLFDLTRGIIEVRDLSPHLLEGSLGDRVELVRREHAYNKDVLRRWGDRRRIWEDGAEGPGARAQRVGKLRAAWECRLRRLTDVVKRYSGRPLPPKFDKYFAWLKRRNPDFPGAEQLWGYLQDIVKELPENREENTLKYGDGNQ